ncbi:MAG: hypothetical protein ACRYFX_27865 [Janthinobacterium lividum]
MQFLSIFWPAHLLTLAGVSLAGPALAQTTPPPVRVTQAASQSLRVRIDNPRQLRGTVQVLRLANGQPLFEESYTAAAYGHRFDFDGVPAGRYALLLKVGSDRYRYVVQVAPQAQGSTMTLRGLATKSLVSSAY